MKKLRLSIAMLLLTAAFSNTVTAQAEVRSGTLQPAGHNDNRYEENRERLGITSEQETPYKEISKKYAENLKEVKQSEMPKEMKLQKAKSLMDRKEVEMKVLLTSAQFKIYQQIQEERKIKMAEKRSKQ